MRANLTAPALATWLVIGTIVCLVWGVPWYVGVLGGLLAAILVFWALAVLEPKWDLIPQWGWSGLWAAFYAALAVGMETVSPSSFEPLTWLYAAIAAWSLLDCIRGFLRRHQPKAPTA